MPSFNVAFPALVVARLFVALSSLPDVLKHNHQLSSPLTSFSQRQWQSFRDFLSLHSPLVQEGIYLFNHDIDIYSGGTFRHVLFYRNIIIVLD